MFIFRNLYLSGRFLKIETYSNEDHRGVAQKTGERFHATDNGPWQLWSCYGDYAVTEMSNEEFLEKDFKVRTYKTNIFVFIFFFKSMFFS